MGLRVFDARTGERVREALSGTNGASEAWFDDSGETWAWLKRDRVHLGGKRGMAEPLDLAGARPVAILLNQKGTHLVWREADGSLGAMDLLKQRQTVRSHHRSDNVRFSPDQSRISAWSGGSALAIYDLQSGERLSLLQGRNGTGEEQVFSPDGHLLATASRDGSVQIWSAKPGRSRLDDEDLLRRLALSRDGRLGATVFISGAISIWETATGRSVRHPPGHYQWAMSVGFSPDGRVLATGSVDQTVRLHDPHSGQEIRALRQTATVSTLAFSGDGTRLVTGDRHGGLWMWHVASGELLAQTDPGHGAVVDLAVLGEVLAVAFENGRVELGNLATFGAFQELGRHQGAAISVAFSPNGETLASTGRDRRLCLWHCPSGRLRGIAATRSNVYRVAFSPDGSRLITGSSADRGGYDYPSLEVWEPELPRQILGFNFDNGQIHSVGFTPDGRSVFGGHAKQMGTGYVFHRESFPWQATEWTAHKPAEAGKSLARYARQYWRQRLDSESNPPTVRPTPLPLPRTEWPARAADVPDTCMDLSDHYNALLNVPWRPLGVWGDFDDHLGNLASGLRELGGIPFDVRGLVVAPPDAAAWLRLRYYAARPSPIRIARAPSQLHFLHATTFRADEGVMVGRYRLQHEDGTVAELPLVYGKNIRSWHASLDERSEMQEARTVWTGTNPTAALHRSSLRLVAWTWTNPNPARSIRSVELEAGSGSTVAPFLVALTSD
jgi:WD40 repeat protein